MARLSGAVTSLRSIPAFREMPAPEVMVKEDDTAKDLLKIHLVPMTNQKVDPAQELPFILAYLKANSQPGEQPAPAPPPPPQPPAVQ